MEIRSIPVVLDNNGNPATDFRIHIGKPNTDPKQEANKLEIRNGPDGEKVSNPFFANKSGRFRNKNGDVVSPYISESEYSIEVTGPNGNRVDRRKRVVSDLFGASVGGGSSTVGAVVNNFQAAKATDLSDFDTIYIQSYASGWEVTAAGPTGDFYAFKTGSVGAPNTGNPGEFYDLAGNQWKPLPSQRLYAEMFGAVQGIGNNSSFAFNDMLQAASARRSPCYADGADYYIDTQSNTDANYSLLNRFAIKMPEYVDLRLGDNTLIKNSQVDSEQYIFFAEDCTFLSISGGQLNGNSSGNLFSGAIYVAGCDYVSWNTRIYESAPFYLASSINKQAGEIVGDALIYNSAGYGISINSGGIKDINLGAIVLDNCANGLYMTSDDIDAFGLTFDKPVLRFDDMDVSQAAIGMKVLDGSVSFGNIGCDTVTTLLELNPGAEDIDEFIGSNISGTCALVVLSNATGGGLLKKFYADSVYARGATTAITIDSADQLIESFVINNIDIDTYSNGLVLGDDTQNGKVSILGGSFGSISSGITINQTNGQDLKMRNTDMSGVTTKITNPSKSRLDIINNEYSGGSDASSNWTSLPIMDWTLANGGGAFLTHTLVTHNLNHTDYQVEATGVDSATESAQVYDKTATTFKLAVRAPGAAFGQRGVVDFNVKSSW